MAKGGDRFERALVKAGITFQHLIATAYADELYIPIVDTEADAVESDPLLPALLSEKFCSTNLVVP